MLQISKNILVNPLTYVLFFILPACGGGNRDETFRNWCIQKTDSAWVELNRTRAEFTYQMDEISERRREMDSLMQILKFKQPSDVNPELLSMIGQYNSVRGVYASVGKDYKNAVLRSEDLFYQIKALERGVKDGKYDKKQDEFKETWEELWKETILNRNKTHEVILRLSAVEPMYLRLQPKIESLVKELTQ